MTLAGGDPSLMSLRRFIDVGFAILVEEYQRLGTDLLTAIEKVGALGGEAEKPPEAVAVDNARAMDQFMGMMKGVKGAPV